MAVCEIISVGTEMLLGDILDTNSRFLSLRLAEMGISVIRRQTVGDNAERLSQAVKEALGRSDIVIATGGLGPTPDDITRDVCAEAFGFRLEFRPELEKQVRAYFDRAGRKMAQSNLRQAYAPVGGEAFENLNGTAPGLGMKKDGKALVLLPGPPYECEPMFIRSVVPFLEEYRSCTIVSHQVRTFGIGESDMAQMAGELLESENPTVAPYCKMGEAYLRVSARAKNEEEAEKIALPVIEKLKDILGDYVYGVDVEYMEQAVVPMLKERGLTVATAESCTAGLISKRITDVPGASAVFKQGAVTYANEVKTAVLGVKKETLDEYGAVSPQTALEMAQGIRRVSGADIGISVTGFAGPDSDEEGKAPGLIYAALSAENYEEVEKIQTGRNDRVYNRTVAASRALNLVRKYLIAKERKANE